MITENVLSPTSAAVRAGSLESFTNSSRRELSIELSFTGLDLRSQTVPLQVTLYLSSPEAGLKFIFILVLLGFPCSGILLFSLCSLKNCLKTSW